MFIAPGTKAIASTLTVNYTYKISRAIGKTSNQIFFFYYLILVSLYLLPSLYLSQLQFPKKYHQFPDLLPMFAEPSLFGSSE